MAGVFGAASIPFIGCVVLLAAEILTVIAFASPFWASDSLISFGIWRKAACSAADYDKISDLDYCNRWNFPWYGDDWILAVRGLESLAIIFFAVPLMIISVYIYVALGLYYRCLFACLTLSVLLGAIGNIAGVVIYGVKIGSTDGWKVGWCLIACIIGGALGIIAFIILLIATINKPELRMEKYFMSGFYADPYKNRLYVVEAEEAIPDRSFIIQPHHPGYDNVVITNTGPVVMASEGGHSNPAIVVDDD